MKLSELKDIGSLDIIQDGIFYTLGYLSQQKSDQLSFLESIVDSSSVAVDPSTSCLITKKDIAPHLENERSTGVALSDNPRKSFLQIHNYLAKKTDFYGTKNAKVIGKNTSIHPSATISDVDVIIGDNCSIGPHVTVFDGSVIGNNVTLGAGTTIGSEGTDYVLLNEELVPVVQAGGVRIHNDVDIHANCCISRATFGGYTEIGESTKIDNLVHIGRGTFIGKRSLIVALAVIGEEAVIGSDVWIGPGSIVSDTIKIGDHAYVSLGSVVADNVLPGQQVTGNFAIDHKKFLSFLKTIR
jgi:UDP-3-O-[3-hydroxymyristoyl] glucosamine N-acyltransferase